MTKGALRYRFRRPASGLPSRSHARMTKGALRYRFRLPREMAAQVERAGGQVERAGEMSA